MKRQGFNKIIFFVENMDDMMQDDMMIDERKTDKQL
jgi:hypothetical protein